MATPEGRLAGLEERIKKRRERNVRLASRVQSRADDRALESAGVPRSRLQIGPGGRLSSVTESSSAAADQIVARARARRALRAGEVTPLASLDTPEERERAAQTLTPRTGDKSQGDPVLATATEAERFIGRQQAFTPLGALSRAVETVVEPASFLFDAGDFTGVRRGIQRRRAVREAIARDEDRGLLAPATDLLTGFAEVGLASALPGGAGRFLAGAGGVVRPAAAGGARAVAGRIAQRTALEAGGGAAFEMGVGAAQGQSLEEINRRGQMGAVFGGVIGGGIGGVVERIAARRFAAREATLAAEREAATAARRGRLEELRGRRGRRLAERDVQSRLQTDPSRALPPGRPGTPEGATLLGPAPDPPASPVGGLPPSRQLPPASQIQLPGEIDQSRVPLRDRLRQAAKSTNRQVRMGASALRPLDLSSGTPNQPTRPLTPSPESMRARLRKQAAAQAAQEAAGGAAPRVEGVSAVAERFVRENGVEAAAATPPAPHSSTSPPPASTAGSLAQRFRRRIADAVDPERARQLQEAYTDRLTGLRNKDAFLEALPRLNARRGTELVMIDLRNFKGINDLESHSAGDRVLADAADAIRRAVGDEIDPRDIFRAGGDEFVIAVPRGQGQRIGRAVVREVGQRQVADTGLTVGARFGVGKNFDAADAAVRAAKAKETGPRFRNAAGEIVIEEAGPPSTSAPAPKRNGDKNLTRKLQNRRQVSRTVENAPEPTGRAANDVPANATNGEGGPVDFEVDPKTGKRIPDQRTTQARQKSALSDSGEGGYLVNPKRDALEAEPEADLPPHQQEAQDLISVGEKQSIRDRLPSLTDLYTMLVRRIHGIEVAATRLGGEGAGTVDEAGVAANIASGSARRAEAALEYGPGRWTPDGEWEPSGTPGLMEILSPLRGQLQALRRYLVAARTLELAKRDIQTGLSPESASRIVQEASPQVRQAQRQIVTYLRDIARYYADATGTPEEVVQKMFDLGQDYFPIQRIFEGKDPFELATGAGTVGRAGQMFRRIRGSRRRMVDPIESIVEYTKRVIRAADTQRVATNLVNAAEANPEKAAGLIARIGAGPDSGALSQAAERLKAAALARGRQMSDEEAQALAEALGAESLTIADDVIRVWQDGNLVSYRVAPEIARGIRAMQPRDISMWVKLFGFPAQFMKAGITLNPAFQAFNVIRDTFDAAIQSKYGFRLGVDSFAGFYQSAKAQWFGQASDIYKEFASVGGGFSTLRGTGRRSTQEQVRRVLPLVRSRTGRVIDVATLPLRHPVQVLKAFGQPFEEAARLGEYMRAKSKDARAVDAYLASKGVTVDFQQLGSEMQGLSYMTAFLNPALQSLDTFMRTAVKRPFVDPARRLARGEATVTEAAAESFREAAKVYGTAIGAISIPSIYFWAASRDDAEIQDLRQTEAGMIYWFIRQPDGEIVRLPKPFLWGQIFGTGMESALDAALKDDPEAMGRWAEGIRNQGSANVLPNSLQIGVELWANRNMFFGTPIVPEELVRVEPRMQYTEYTSRLARKLGDLAGRVPGTSGRGVSPARIDHVMRQVAGTLPIEIVRGVERALDRFGGAAVTPPAPTKSDALFFGRFFQRQPSLNTESVQVFWENAKAAEEAMASFRMLAGRGDDAAMDAMMDRRFEDFAVASLYEGTRTSLADLRNSINAVRDMPDEMFNGEDPATEKREMIDEFLRMYLELARVSNEVAADILSAVEATPAPEPAIP